MNSIIQATKPIYKMTKCLIRNLFEIIFFGVTITKIRIELDMIHLVLRFVYISGHLVFDICVSSTTKYTLLTFLPKNLFEQFHRFANLYFLFIVLLNWVPSINAFGKEISMLPVIFVLGVTAIKDAFEDRRRYVSDKRVNNSTCRIYNR